MLQAVHSVRRDAQRGEPVDTDLLFRWFLNLDPSKPAFDHTAFDQTAFTHDRPRPERQGVVAALSNGVVRRATGR